MKVVHYIAAVSCLLSNLKNTNGQAKVPPNVYDITAGFNIFIGQTPSEQQQGLRTSTLFYLTGPRTLEGKLYQTYNEISNIDTTDYCRSLQYSHEVSWATSTFSLKDQAEKSSDGFQQDIGLGVEVPVKGATVSAETTIRNALVFGNSRTSSTSFQQRDSGFERSFHAYTQRYLYSMEVDHDKIVNWNQELSIASAGLNSQSSTTKVLKFFEEFGTHGLEKAHFGKQCTSSMYMRGGFSMTAYQDFKQQERYDEKSFLWWKSTSSSSESSLEGRSDEYGFAYRIDNKFCEGHFATHSPCGDMKSIGTNSPAIINWTYKPIWEMNIPSFSPAGKAKVKQVFNNVMEASVRCAEKNCNGNGACASKLSFWDSIENYGDYQQVNLEDIFDGSKCFCTEDYEGARCERGRPIKIVAPQTPPTVWANEFDGPMVRVYNGKPLCGMNSYHDNNHEDRLFRFYTCEIDEQRQRQIKGTQTTHASWWDQPFTFSCDMDKVMTNIVSFHHNGHEDRIFAATCSHFEDTVIDPNTCDYSYNDFTGFMNQYDQYFDFKCDAGKVITAIHSVHNNGHEDRRFKFRCCGLMNELGIQADAITRSEWTPYLNGFDGDLYTMARIGDQYGAICGVSSHHDNGREDRQFRFKYCAPNNTPSIVAHQYVHQAYSFYDSRSYVECPADSVVMVMNSYHNNDREDRFWVYQCFKFIGWKTDNDMCHWTDYVNWYDQPIHFECGSQHVLTGVESIHDNGSEDRRFKFKCCRWRPET